MASTRDRTQAAAESRCCADTEVPGAGCRVMIVVRELVVIGCRQRLCIHTVAMEGVL